MMKNIFKNIKKVLNISGKVFLVFAVFVFVINLFIIFSPNNKEKIDFSKITEQNRAEIYKNIDDKELNSTDQGRAMLSWYRFINCTFIGEACTNNPSDGIENHSFSIFGLLTKAIDLPYKIQPASGLYWVYDSLQNTNLVPKTYATEGIGYSTLKSLTNLWKIFRNAAYLVLVIILIAIGFMIMFRVKLNPQTVISLENSLPRIVVTLLLITFSFPIAGFMIDLMYVVMALGIMLFSGYIDVGSNLQILSGNGWSLFDKIFKNGDIWSVGGALFQILPAATGTVLRTILGFVTFYLITRFKVPSDAAEGEVFNGIGGFFGKILSAIAGATFGPLTLSLLVGFGATFILSIVVFMTALFVFFRIFFLLFKSYIKILLLVIFSPIILLLDAVPGRKMFLVWLKNMTSNLIAFPIVSTLIILSSVISSLGNEGKLWTPPFLYSNQNSPIVLLVSIGILFIIPDVVKVIRGAMGVKEGALSTGSGLFFGGAGAAFKTATSPISQLGSLSLGFRSIVDLKDKLRNRGKPKASGTA